MVNLAAELRTQQKLTWTFQPCSASSMEHRAPTGPAPACSTEPSSEWSVQQLHSIAACLTTTAMPAEAILQARSQRSSYAVVVGRCKELPICHWELSQLAEALELVLYCSSAGSHAWASMHSCCSTVELLHSFRAA